MKQKKIVMTLVLIFFFLVNILPITAEAALYNNMIGYLSFKDADLKDVLYMLAKQSGLNIVLDEKSMNNSSGKDGSQGSAKKITLNLTNVPLFTALDLVVASAGLDYAKIGNAIVVGEKNRIGKNFNTLVTEKIKLKYANAFKVKDTLVSLNVVDYENIYVYGEYNNFDTKINTQEKDVLFRRDETKSNTKTDQNDNGKLSVSKLGDTKFDEIQKPDANEANILVVRDTAANLKKIKNIIIDLDKPAPRIMVEAKVLELNESGMSEVGIDWTTLNSAENPGTMTLLTVNENSRASNPNGGKGTFFHSPLNFNAIVRAQIDKGNGKVLATPKISTLEGKRAYIFVGDKVPYISEQEVDKETKTVTNKIDFLSIGVNLEVIPVLTENGDVQMKIYSEVSSTAWKKIDNIEFPMPTTRQAETIARVKAGSPVIIGGLINETESKNVSKLPILGDLPLINKLFSWENSSKDKTEIIITLTPYIIND